MDASQEGSKNLLYSERRPTNMPYDPAFTHEAMTNKPKTPTTPMLPFAAFPEKAIELSGIEEVRGNLPQSPAPFS